MSGHLRFLIIDGYSKQSRNDLEKAGMQLAWKLYAKMLQNNCAGAEYDVLLPSDPGVELPGNDALGQYAGILWTGCNLCINDDANQSVTDQLSIAESAYSIGIPSFGSCWGLQVSVVAAGGEVEPNPKGKEMGIARKLRQTEAAYDHPMFDGKPKVFEAFISHDDHVTKIPEGGILLAGNDWTEVQALSVTHKKGTFWSVQYHPEYDLHEMACLIIAREPKLIKLGFYRDHEDLLTHVNQLKALSKEPERKDLRWRLAIDDDVLATGTREREFSNFISQLVLPRL